MEFADRKPPDPQPADPPSSTPRELKRNRARIPAIVAVVFWIWFVGSIALVKRYPWLDSVWSAAWMLLLAVAAVWSTIQTFRHGRHAGGYVGYRGVPRWLAVLFSDGVKSNRGDDSGRKGS
jgi:hypothetical protein